jgi:hypothetical protein
MNTQQAKEYATEHLNQFIGKDMSNLSLQQDFLAVFTRVVRHFHREGFVVYNDGIYDLTLWREQHQFVGDHFQACWVYNPRM